MREENTYSDNNENTTNDNGVETTSLDDNSGDDLPF